MKKAPAALPTLRVRSLGGFAVWRGDEPIPPAAWSRRKVLALFTCLLGAPAYRLHRERLIDSLWPEAAADAGANSLRVTLHRLRALLDGPSPSGSFLRTEGDVVALIPLAQGQPAAGSEGDWFDAASYARMATVALSGQDLAGCRVARARYTGDYLPDMLYDDWVDARRDELRQQYLALLLHGARLCREQGDEHETADWLAAVLAHERCHEQAARSLMRLFARSGRHDDALRVYEALVSALQTDLGQPPERKTQALAAAIREERAAARGAERPAPPPSEASPPGSAVAPLPEGALTFLLTDVEGSTALWEQYPAAMRAAIARHDILVGTVLAQHGGRQIKDRGEGDSIFAVFSRPSAALVAVCALQQALHAEPWPEHAALRVRMGLHTGEADLRDGGYYGVAVNRTARVRSLGHGGQILLSRSTYDVLRDELPTGVELRSLGTFTLKGLQRPEEIYQVVHAGLPSRFPPLAAPAEASPESRPLTNLPSPVSTLVGRSREQQEIAALLERHRLVTLTGPGGVGKTRLALAVAGALAPRPPDGVWLVELAALDGTTDPGAPLVGQMVASALGLREEADRPILATLTEYLTSRSLLLVLDNCEHLVVACATLVATLLRACPGLRILASSRERLEVAGEIGYPVLPLRVPDRTTRQDVAALLAYDAVALFVERARERRPSFILTGQNAPAVAQISARLDGIPLAIELAAARLGALPIEEIAARLDDRFRLLTGGPRTVQPRQQTLRAALDWSYNLLADPERVLLRRLSVFAGSCTLDAAEAVCAGDGLDEWLIVDLLGGLVNRSLVGLDETPTTQDPPLKDRYRLLETVRQYGWERLIAAGEADALRDRHLAWCLRLATDAEPALLGPDQAQWLARLEAEYDNIRAALTWSVRAEEMSEPGTRLATALWRYWEIRGQLGEGRVWLEAAAASGAAAPSIRARGLTGAGFLAQMQGDLERAVTLCTTCLALRREQGDRRGIAQTLYNLGLLMFHRADSVRATELFEESLSVARDLGDAHGVSAITNSLGLVARLQRDYARAQTLFEEALALGRDQGDTRAIAIASNNLGTVARDLGDLDCARRWYEQALALHRQLEDSYNCASSLVNLAELAADTGDTMRAVTLYQEGLALYRDLDGKPGIASCLEGLARIALQCEQPVCCATLLGAAEQIRETTGVQLGPDEQASYGRTATALRAALDEPALTQAWTAGRIGSVGQAIDAVAAFCAHARTCTAATEPLPSAGTGSVA